MELVSEELSFNSMMRVMKSLFGIGNASVESKPIQLTEAFANAA